MKQRLTQPRKTRNSQNGIMYIYQLEPEVGLHNEEPEMEPAENEETVAETATPAPPEYSVHLLRSNHVPGFQNGGVTVTQMPVDPSFFPNLNLKIEKDLPAQLNQPEQPEQSEQ